MIHHIVPWKTGDIGGGINEAIDLLPADAWICLRDGDTMWLTPKWGKQVEEIVAAYRDQYALIGAMTNRIRSPDQLYRGRLSDDPHIGHHVEIAQLRQQRYWNQVVNTPATVAGFCMIFSKAEWARHPFPSESIYFDQEFCRAVRDGGGQVGIALGLYVFHLYRWGKPSPTSYIGHLR